MCILSARGGKGKMKNEKRKMKKGERGKGENVSQAQLPW
jgi:hypothetical protein